MTNEEFCKYDTAFYGEKVDKISQIAKRTFTGEELKEYVEHCMRLHANYKTVTTGLLSTYEDCDCPEPFKCLRICDKLIERCANDPQ